MTRGLTGWQLALITGLVITASVYWPGLHGGYLFDDFPNIVDNRDVQVSTLDLHDWRIAAQASPSAELRRPLAMLSFAANYYCTGLDPFPMKLVNLGIHLLNGILLWRILLELLALWRRRNPASISGPEGKWLATAVAVAWLLTPVNLSAVLYVVQRMEILAQVFVLAGLWLYLVGRRRMLEGTSRAGPWLCATGLILGSSLGLLCKESAVLLPVYTLLLELAVLRFEAPVPGQRRLLWVMYSALLLLPGVLSLAWLLPHTLPAAAYATRPFTLEQRLLTEARVLVEYVRWVLWPDPTALSFYHDDIRLSRGWFDPPSTALAAALIVATIAAACRLRRCLPLFTLGVGWYFFAHLLTATVIPLELVFEHRNYFASIGVLLAAGALVLAIPAHLHLLRTALPVLTIGAFAGATLLRASEWSDPVTFAYTEAAKHPLSTRASYELGRTLVVASGYREDSKLIDPAMAAFEKAADLPGAGASPVAALIIVAGHMNRPTQPQWWSRLADSLAAQPPSAESVSALQALYQCQHDGHCPAQPQQLLTAFLAALAHSTPSGRLLSIYGIFAANQLHDYPLAERVLGDAAILLPDAGGVRINLAKVLYLEGKYQEAGATLTRIDTTRLGREDALRLSTLSRDIDAHTRGIIP